MHVGAQINFADDELRFAAQMGVGHVDLAQAGGLGIEECGHWLPERLSRLRSSVEAHGLELEAMHLPLTSAGIEKQVWPHIMLGRPERDREIEQVCKCIEAASHAGIKTLLYNLAFLPVVRSGRTPGRGGVTCSHLYYEQVREASPHPLGPLTADQAWERIAYFVERVIPVAEEYKVRLGCHQHDPGFPQGVGYRGVERVLGSIEGVKRFVDLHPSPYHGLNFCQGTIAEMCTSPEEVYEAIRYFGSRGRIFWVHLRNIRGGWLRFDEVFPDEGDIDMCQAIRLYREVGYDGALVPDHVPRSEFDAHGGRHA